MNQPVDAHYCGLMRHVPRAKFVHGLEAFCAVLDIKTNRVDDRITILDGKRNRRFVSNVGIDR